MNSQSSPLLSRLYADLCYWEISVIVALWPVDLFSEDLDKYDNEGKYRAIELFCSARISEGWRLDYTENWDDRTLEKVAAFANTFGGMLLVGVKKDKGDAEPLIVGVNSPTEYKTRIASSIAANIPPVPPYHVYECHKPGQVNSKLCVIQVRNVNAFHLLTKKNIKPIHVRNEDETREADAADIRRLLERHRSAEDLISKFEHRANDTFRLLRVRTDRKNLGGGREAFSESQSFLKVILISMEFQRSYLEKAHEDDLKRLIRAYYPRVQRTESHSVSQLTEDRDGSFFEWGWYHTGIDWDMRWRITSEGQIAHATQIRLAHDGQQHQWSVVDLCDFLFLFLSLGAAWREEKGYFGDGVLYADISTDNLPVSQISQGAFGLLFGPTNRYRDFGFISSDAVRLSATGRSRAYARQALNPNLMRETSVDTVLSLSNTLLRNLGHLVDTQRLSASLTSLYASEV